MLRVRFGGFSVLKITKSLRATLVDKLAHLGGTIGLFTGVSYITAFELLKFIALSLIMPCQSKENKVKISKEEEAKKSQFKECETKIKVLEKKVDYNTQKFNDMEKRMIVHDYTLIEDNQNVEDYRKVLDLLKIKSLAMDNLTKKVDVIDNLTKKVDAMDNLTKKLDSKLDVVMERLLGEK